VRQIIAVCPVLDPQHTLLALETGPWIYRHYFLRKWRASLQRKANVHPDLLMRLTWHAQHTLTAMTDHFVRGHTHFKELQHYLAGYAITGDRLNELQFPAYVLLAEDDPVIPVSDWHKVNHHHLLRCTTTSHGGHCGFILDWSFNGWIEQHIAEVLRESLGECWNRPATIDATPKHNQEHE
jgi:hypothetical protein